MRTIEQFIMHPEKGARYRIFRGYTEGGWETRVPLKCKTLQDAKAWLIPDGADDATPRQGDLYFVQCNRPPKGEFTTEAGSVHITTYERCQEYGHHSFSKGTLVRKRGSVLFVGYRGRMKSHDYEALPRLFVKGTATHAEHEALKLCACEDVDKCEHWYEVIPQRGSDLRNLAD